ncbi:amidase family protein, partial [bacterium]|nr:amidase family protein [bacterium]
GKTNMDAFAHGASTETSDFFTTKNPWDVSRVPGGSSGGSAAAVISDMCIFGIGSETGGSIRHPAAWSGVTGMKPTYGRVSRYGLIAMQSSSDSPGPMTKTVEDAALVLEVIAGKDSFDATTSPEITQEYTEDMHTYSLEGVKIGKPKSYFEIEFDPGVKEKIEKSLEMFEKLGAEIVDIELLAPKYAIALYTIQQRSEVSSNLARFDGIRYGHTRDAFGQEARKRMMLGAYALSAGYYDQYYALGQRVRTLVIEDFKKAFEKVDLIVGAMPTVATKIGDIETSPFWAELIDLVQLPSSMAGLAVVAIPAGFVDNLPVNIQIMGQRFDESSVLGAAHKFQEVTSFHKERPKLV